jgi:CxxC motif-containing protein (DUF1111 family)
VKPAIPLPQSKPAAIAEPAPSGHELFTREWLPNDARAHGGDGLGPVYNDSSCVACHNQGGTGGAGPSSKNVDILTAFRESTLVPENPPPVLAAAVFDSLFGTLAPRPGPPDPDARLTPEQRKLARQQERQELMRIHPGFASGHSLVLHHFGADPKYDAWRTNMLNGQVTQMNEPGQNGQGEQNLDSNGTSQSPPTPQTAVAAKSAAPNAPPPVGTPQRASEASPPAASAANNVTAKQVPEAVDPFAAPVTTRTEIAEQQIPDGIADEISRLQGKATVANADIQVGNVQIARSQRNPTALFGVGLIDAIPQQAIVDLAKVEAKAYPEIAGRPSKQKDGRIGRFGWKAQKATLQDFALTACAVELGLNVPGHEQGGLPLKPDYKAPGLDMNQRECDALVAYLKALPAPIERKPATEQEATMIGAGHKLFAATGCANCHVEKLGPAQGIYSDLLLHDMGEQLGDTGSYGVFTPNAPEEEQPELPSQQANADGPNGSSESGELTPAQLAKVIGALRQEWRTPPLWGVRDSGPYLHDGRADTLEQAIAFHGGQATQAAVKFFLLKPAARQQLITFLKSLTAPDQAALQRSETVDSMIPKPHSTEARRSLSIARTTTH